MRIGISLLFQNLHDDLADDEVVRGDMDLAVLAEELGFDYVAVVEHHFDSYSMCPDNFQVLAYLAAKTSKIELQTAAVILPWNDPLRVAERLIVLDHLSGGRVVFGVGRGLAKMEYEGFRQDMNESRERFDESIEMIMNALDSGQMTGDGHFYKQPPVQLRPRPLGGSFRDRFFSVAMSPPSAEAAADIGAAMLLFPSKPIEEDAASIFAYRERFEAQHNRPAPNVTFSDLTFCHPDPDLAAKVMHDYGLRQHHSFYGHYSMDGSHWNNTKGYENYAAISKALLNTDAESSLEIYNSVQACGTPEEIINTIKRRVEILGPHDTTFNFSWGGIPYDLVHQSITLFAKNVLPQLKTIDHATIS